MFQYIENFQNQPGRKQHLFSLSDLGVYSPSFLLHSLGITTNEHNILSLEVGCYWLTEIHLLNQPI